MSNKNSFVLYQSYKEHISLLTDEQKGQLFQAIFDFNDNQEINLDPISAMAFSFIKSDLEKNKAKYEEKCEKNRENARARWERMRSHTNVDSKDKKDATACDRIKRNANYADNDDDDDYKKKKIQKEKGRSELEIPLWIDKKIWNEFLKVRKNLKAVQSDLALSKIISKLGDLREEGYNANEILTNSVVNSWKGVFKPLSKPTQIAGSEKKEITEEEAIKDSKNSFTPKELGVSTGFYNSWLKQTAIEISKKEKIAKFIVPQEFYIQQIEFGGNMSDIKHALKSKGAHKVEFEVGNAV